MVSPLWGESIVGTLEATVFGDIRDLIPHHVAVKLPDIMPGSIIFENILSMSIRMASYTGWL